MRRDGAEPALLMGRRSGASAFMPGKWVFPGGRTDPADARAPAAAELRPEVAARLDRLSRPGRGRALALAAVRETFEETGLLLARPAPPRPGAGPWRPFLAEGALPHLAALDFVARAVTPPGRVRRFDARFFLADASALLSPEPKGGDRELEEVAWIPLGEVDRLDLPQITRFVLAELGARLHDPDRPVPFARVLRGRRRVDPL